MPRKPAIPSPEAALALVIGEIVAVGSGDAIAAVGLSIGVGNTRVAGWASVAATGVGVGAVTAVAVASAAIGVPVAAAVDTPEASNCGVAVNVGGARVAGARVDSGVVTTARVGADSVGADSVGADTVGAEGVGAACGAQIWANDTGGRRTAAASALTTSHTHPSTWPSVTVRATAPTPA